MDKSQYQTPRTIYNPEIYAQIEQSTLPHAPERALGPFHFVKEMDALVDSFRDTAEALEQRDGRELKIKYVPITFTLPARSHAEIRKDLIEQEREIMIAEEDLDPFAVKGTFSVWKGENGHSLQRSPDIDDWYIERVLPGKMPKTFIRTGEITHIESHPDHLRKFDSFGRPVPLTIEDIQVFVPLTYYYVRGILNLPAYRFDKERAEVLLDDMEIPTINQATINRDNVTVLLPPKPAEHWQSDDRLAA